MFANQMRLLSICIFFLLGFSAAQGQKRKPADISQLIQSKNYIFKAESVMPSKGGFRNVASDFDFRVFGDSVISYLPYFGVAYTAPANPEQSVLQFTSTHFQYSVQPGKKDGWSISIIPADQTEVRQIYLDVTSTGYASLRFSFNNHEPISFNGYIQRRQWSKE